ncbi:hypothetical protein NEAUS05_1091 [Nematocida ausubeli]|nr:hypothetical protein NEAUS05_1091 [Nematocida ausubeli]
MTLLTLGIALGVYIYNKKIHLKKNNLQDSGSTHKPLEIPSTVNNNEREPKDLTNNSTPADDLNSSHKEEISSSVYMDCPEYISATIEEGNKKMESSENNPTSKFIEEQKQEKKSWFFSTNFKSIFNFFRSGSSTKDIAKDASIETIMNTEAPSEENSETQQIPSEEDEESGMTEEEKLKNILGKIRTACGTVYNIPDDYISNEETQKNILSYFNEVVIEELYKDRKHKYITLKDLLIELSKIQEKSNDILPIGLRYVSFKYPSLFKEDKYMHRLLLGYYNRKNGSLDKLKIEGFSLTDKDFGISSFSELLRNIEDLCLLNTVVSIDLLRAISEMKNLQVLELGEQTKILEDSTPELNLSNIQKLYMHDIDSTSAQKILQLLGPRDKDLDLTITRINFIPSSVINNIKCLDKIEIFKLSNTTFEKEPDFGFLEKMKSLDVLRLYKIRYSSTEELNEENINEIQEKVDLLSPTSQQLDEKNDLPNNKVSLLAKNNMKIGEQLTASRICVDGKLYNDLGLSKLNVKENATINVMFHTILQENTSSPYSINFSIYKELRELNIYINSRITPCKAIINILKGISYPFTECSDVEKIYVIMDGKEDIRIKFANRFLSKLTKYSRDKNNVKKIIIEVRGLCDISTSVIDAFNRKFKKLYFLELKNISLTVSEKSKENTENGLDKQTSISYEKVNDSIKDYLFRRKTKAGNLEMVNPK